MSNLPRPPVETLHHIATFAEQMARDAQRANLPFVAYLLSMASQEARAELKNSGFPIAAGRAAGLAASSDRSEPGIEKTLPVNHELRAPF